MKHFISADKGMALPLVLWMIVLGAGFVAVIQLLEREMIGRVLFASIEHRIQQEVDSAFELATYDLLRLEPDERPYKEGHTKAYSKQVTVEIIDACGRIDINWADKTLMRSYALTNGLSATQTNNLVNAVELARKKQALPYGVLDNLRDVMPEMSDQDWYGFSEGLTVACPASGVDPALANRPVMRALTRLGLEEQKRFTQTSSHQFFEITVTAKREKVNLTERRWLALVEQPNRPFVVTGRQRIY